MYLRTLSESTVDRTRQVLRRNARRVAPVWPLKNFVAVNPFMGMTDRSFDDVAHRMERTHGANLVMPTKFYLDQLAAGTLDERDIEHALVADASATTVAEFLRQLRVGEALPGKAAENMRFETVVDVASKARGRDFARFTTDHLSRWAAGYFDDGQAQWRAESDESLWQAWRTEAAIDRTPEFMGLKGFRRFVEELPDSPYEAAQAVFEALGVRRDVVDVYLERLGARLAGWAGFAARIDWDARLRGAPSTCVEELLVVLLAWEFAVWRACGSDELNAEWSAAREAMTTARTNTSLDARLILHRAYERARQRELIAGFDAHADASQPDDRPAFQAVFCIDVRSEILRRHLEQADSGIETLGFAGFFGMPVEVRHPGDEHGEAHCPALVAPAHEVTCGRGDPQRDQADATRRADQGLFDEMWSAFKDGAVSCFGFVSPLGLTRLPALFRDSYGLRQAPSPDLYGVDLSALTLRRRAELAETALRGMSLTERFARVVVIAGHAATMTNNPHASGYDCGACGGRSGEPNALVLTAILKDSDVRKELAERGIAIPDDTVFVAALHDTTTDRVRLNGVQNLPETHADDIARLTDALETAGRAARTERADRLGIADDVDRAIDARIRDWAQTRPEWGLAGCTSFVVAPRHRTRRRNLGGKAFLHNYDWQSDTDFETLENIMTAPMVVTSWINLQYFASTVDNGRFGAGDKTLHNVVGKVGVFEGAAGDLRTGLPLQAVHNGESFQHDPVRLQVFIEAPAQAMNTIIERNETVRELVDNGWIQLFSLDQTGRVSGKYVGQNTWTDPHAEIAAPAARESA